MSGRRNDFTGYSHEALEEMLYKVIGNMSHILVVLAGVIDSTSLCEDEDELKEFAKASEVPFPVLQRAMEQWHKMQAQSDEVTTEEMSIRDKRIDDLLENHNVPAEIKDLLRKMRADADRDESDVVIVTIGDN